MKFDVFLSCKSEDYVLAQEVCDYLSFNGLNVFFAKRDVAFIGNADYKRTIDEAIDTSQNLIVVATKIEHIEYLTSPWVYYEWNLFAKEKLSGRKSGNLMTIVSDGINNSSLPIGLRGYECLFISNYKSNILSFLKSDLQNYPIIKNANNTSLMIQDFDYERGEILYKEKEYNEAVLALLSSAKNNYSKAKNLLCQLFYDLNDKIDLILPEVWDIVESYANKNHCFANFILHTKYYKDSSTFTKSFECLREAIKDNTIPLATLRLAIHYGWGIGVKQNNTLELYYYQKAEKEGCVQAYSYIGQLYEAGNSKVQADRVKALDNYLKGAEANDQRAICKLISFYLKEANYDKAKEWANKAIDLGYDDGYRYIGDIEFAKNGNQYNADIIKIYKDAARREVKGSFFTLAQYYYYDCDDIKEAYKFALQGAKSGDSLATYFLGYLNENDDSLTEETRNSKAWKYYMQCYTLYGICTDDLGRLYIEKEYRPKDFDVNMLVNILEIGAGNAIEPSHRYLVKLFSEEKYGIKNSKRIDQLYEQGARLGYAEDMFRYGMIFLWKKIAEFATSLELNGYSGCLKIG